MKNVYWTIKYLGGWMDNHCHSTRTAAIQSYLSVYSSGRWADKDWAWHKRYNKVKVVKVFLQEITDKNRESFGLR